jgi:hypothetical protein
MIGETILSATIAISAALMYRRQSYIKQLRRELIEARYEVCGLISSNQLYRQRLAAATAELNGRA